MAEPFLIYGHRGSPKRFPENTIASFDETLRAGADGFETDLRMLADGTSVLFHDHELDDIEVETLTLDQCRDRGAAIDRLSALARYAGRTTMILEIKRRGWETALLRAVDAWPNCVFASFDHSILAALRSLGTSIPLGITVYGYPLDLAAYAERLGATWCFPSYRQVDESMVTSLRGRGIRIVPWAPNRPAEWNRLRDLGCHGVITDLPVEAVAWRRGRQR